MLPYRTDLKDKARKLRSNQTEAEHKLWHYLRRKQLNGCSFNRQKPIDQYIVDFYCHSANLVVEVDGGQHYCSAEQSRDAARVVRLRELGLKVLRFSNLEVLQNIDGVVERIFLELNPP